MWGGGGGGGRGLELLFLGERFFFDTDNKEREYFCFGFLIRIVGNTDVFCLVYNFGGRGWVFVF